MAIGLAGRSRLQLAPVSVNVQRGLALRSWPRFGDTEGFNCVACEAPMVAVYAPDAAVICPHCGIDLRLPPYPSWHPDAPGA
jgi:hypothetical protein